MMPTPFDDRGGVDTTSLARLTDYLIGAGVHGLAVCGVAGEGYALSDEERQLVAHTVLIQARRRVPVLVGCGYHSGQAAATLCSQLANLGVDGLLVMPPFFVKPSDAAIADYFRMISDAVSVPIIIQDNPQWTSIQLSPALFLQLAELNNVYGIKVEAPYPPAKMRAIRHLTGDRLHLLGGLAGNWFPEELAAGSSGTMPAALVPQIFCRVWQIWSSGHRDEALTLFHRFHPIIRVTSQPSVGCSMVKHLLARLGVLATDHVRNPLVDIQPEDRADLEAVCGGLSILEVMRPAAAAGGAHGD